MTLGLNMFYPQKSCFGRNARQFSPRIFLYLRRAFDLFQGGSHLAVSIVTEHLRHSGVIQHGFFYRQYENQPYTSYRQIFSCFFFDGSNRFRKSFSSSSSIPGRLLAILGKENTFCSVESYLVSSSYINCETYLKLNG